MRREWLNVAEFVRIPIKARVVLAVLFIILPLAQAEPPVAVYAFPAGGQRGTEVSLRVGGLFFHGEAEFAISGPGVSADPVVNEIPRLWFEGPILHQPGSQRGEDYPRDHTGRIRIDPTAPLGPRRWHCRTVQGTTQSLPFLVGDLPEIVEEERDGTPVPVKVEAPVTINGRIFPRQDIDWWEISAAKGEWITGEIMAKRLGYPLDPSIAVTDPAGQVINANLVLTQGDPRFAFQAPASGLYRIAISDGNFIGGMNFIYRLTLNRGPQPTSVFPLGGKRGETVDLEWSGHALAQPIRQTLTLTNSEDEWQSVMAKNGASFFLQVGDDPEVIEATHPVALPLPGVANGLIAAPGEHDDWSIELKKDQIVKFEIFAARLGSPLDSRLAVIDDTGKELGANDDAAPGNADSLRVFTAPKDGTYVVRVSDQFASRGGPDFAYRLSAQSQDPADFRLTVTSDSLTVVRDLPPVVEANPEPVDPKAKPPRKPRVRGTGLTVTMEPFGTFKSDVLLEVDGLPDGVTIDEATRKIPFAKKTTELFLDADPDCPIQSGELRIRGTAEIDGQHVIREAILPFRLGEPASGSVRFAVAPAPPFKFVGDYWVETGYPVGSRLTKAYQLERAGFDGALKVELSDRQIRHLQGVTAEPMMVPPGADSFTYTITLPPRMEMGRTSRSQLMISGEITEPDGKRYLVSYTNAQPEQQMMSIVSEGRLHLATSATSVRVIPNGSTKLSVTAKRDRSLVALPLRLEWEVPDAASDVSAEPVQMAPGAETAEIEVRFGAHPGPFLQTVKLRAVTVTDDPALQHAAEVELEFVSIEQG